MKVILKTDVKGLGKAGELVEAKTGYARNFLFPRKWAVEATPENYEAWEKEQQEIKEKEAVRKEEAMALKEKIEKTTVTLKTKGGSGDKIFGSITSADIAKALQQEFNLELDKKKIEMKENIKTIGTYEIPVRVYPEVTATLKVSVEKK